MCHSEEGLRIVADPSVFGSKSSIHRIQLENDVAISEYVHANKPLK